MIKPARFALEADRWTPFVTTIEFEGVDLTGAVFEAHIRLLPDTPGAPLVDLDTVTTAAAEGVRLISVIGTGDDAVSSVGIRINETTMEGLPVSAELGLNTRLYWDLHITPSGGVKQVYAGGEFIVRAGVTQ
jgi:hypothetical protein